MGMEKDGVGADRVDCADDCLYHREGQPGGEPDNHGALWKEAEATFCDEGGVRVELCSSLGGLESSEH